MPRIQLARTAPARLSPSRRDLRAALLASAAALAVVLGAAPALAAGDNDGAGGAGSLAAAGQAGGQSGSGNGGGGGAAGAGATVGADGDINGGGSGGSFVGSPTPAGGGVANGGGAGGAGDTAGGAGGSTLSGGNTGGGTLSTPGQGATTAGAGGGGGGAGSGSGGAGGSAVGGGGGGGSQISAGSDRGAGGGGSGGSGGGGGGGGGYVASASGGGGGGYAGYIGSWSGSLSGNTFIGGGGGGGAAGSGGGGGGAGAVFTSNLSGPVSILTGDITGGGGGGGGVGAAAGNGGTGLLLSITPVTNLEISGTVRGGNGGDGGNASTVPAGGGVAGGEGGRGIGVESNVSVAHITVTGSVIGGNGGANGTMSSGQSIGGEGIYGQDIAIRLEDGGTISGGLGSDSTRAASIAFTGGQNSLALGSGGTWTLTGDVQLQNGAVVTFGQSTDASLANVISGAGSIVKSGSGTLTLSGDNSFDGGVTITGGTLAISETANLGTGAVTFNGGTLAITQNIGNLTRDFIVNASGGTLNVADGVTAGTSNDFSGLGAFTKTGGGSYQLAGDTSGFTGVLTVQEGTLRLGNSASFANASRVIVNATLNVRTEIPTAVHNLSGGENGRILLNNDLTVIQDTNGIYGTYAGVISGSGSLTKEGIGGLILTGNSTYTGLTTINAGTLQLGNGGASGSIVSDVQLNTNGTLAFNRSDVYTFPGTIRGDGQVIFTGSGTVLFSSPDAYTGPISVNNATMHLQDGSVSASPVTVNAGGVISGNGTIGGLTVNSGGIAAPGNSPGTISVSGPVAFNSGSIYRVDVVSNGTAAPLAIGGYDRILATGAVTLDTGATVLVVATPGVYAPNQSVPIITTTSTVTGTFGGVTSNYAFLQPSLTYDPQNVYLTLVYNEVAFAAYAQTANQVNTAVGAQALDFGNPVFDALLEQSTAGVPVALNQLSGEIYPSVNTLILQEAVYLREAVTARLRQSQGFGALFSAAQGGPATAALGQGLTPTLWAQGFGGWGNAFGNGNAATISSSVGGVFGGLDVSVADNVRAGIVGGFSQTQFDVDARNSSGTMDNYDIGIYAGGQFGAFALRGGLSYTWHDVSVGRTVLFPGFTGATDGSYTVGTTQLFGEAAYDFAVGAYAFEPFLGLAYLNVSGGSLSEGGFAANGSALSVNLDGMNTFYTTLGMRVATTMQVYGHALTPSLTLGWQHAFGDTTPTATMLFQGGSTPFSVQGVPIAEDAAVLGAGLAYGLSDRATLQVNYTGQIAADASQNAFTAQFSLKF